MKILITAPDTFTGAELQVGRYYNAEPAENPTEKQNKTFHALCQEYWRSGCHSYNAKSFEHFRALIKLNLGAGLEKYKTLVDTEGRLYSEPVISHRLKSWADYTKKERRETIDRLIAEMHQAGVTTRKFNEILEGMEVKD